MPLILLLTMIAIFFYYNAQENIKGFYKTRGFQGKVQITGIGWADKITYRMNKEDEVKNYLIFHIDYQETINNQKVHVKTQLPLHIQDLLYPYIASPTESDSDVNRQNSEYKILPDEREYWDDFVKKSIKINPKNQKFINDISRTLNTEKDFKNIIVQIETVPDTTLSTYERGHSKALGGYYDFSLKDALRNKKLVVQLNFPSSSTSKEIDLHSQLEQVLKKSEVTEERTQRELSEEEWSFPIWRWAAFSLFDTLILVSPLTRELISPGESDSRFYLGKSLGNLILDDTQRFIFIIIILTLLLPAFALIVESLLFSKGCPLLSMICSCLIFVIATVLFVYSLSIVPDFWSITIYSYMLYPLFNVVSYLRKINRIINLRKNSTKTS